jgi:hypothetical protein
MPRPPGRPRAEIETEVIAVRLARALRERLDRYLDLLEVREGMKASRSALVGHALTFFLDAKDALQGRERSEQHRVSPPPLETPVPSVQPTGPPQPAEKPRPPRSPLRRQILTALREHPEGLSPAQTQQLLGTDKHLSDTMQGMARDGLLQHLGTGLYGVTEG